MYVTKWSDPYSALQTWEIDGWFLFTISRTEIIETTRPEVMYLVKIRPMVGLAMPVHDAPRDIRSHPLRLMLQKMHEVDKKAYGRR